MMLWLLKGPHDAPGWKVLLSDAKQQLVDWRLLDRDAFVIIRAEEAPTQYDGMLPTEPADGLYLDQQGNSICIVNCEEVSPRELIEALGEQAATMHDKLGDHFEVLQRLGKVY